MIRRSCSILLWIVVWVMAGDLKSDTAAVSAILNAAGLPQVSIWTVADTLGGRVTRIILNSGITQLSGRIGDLSALQNLYLEGNSLAALPPEMAQCTSLVRVSLQDNNFSEFPQVLLGLPHLAEIRFSYNYLTKLPDGIENMPSLVLLFCDSNLLDSLPASLCRSPTLQQLNFRLNRLAAIPDSISQLKKTLTVLTLLGNYLEDLPESIGELDQVTLFDVQSNHICSLGPIASVWVDARDPNWQLNQVCTDGGQNSSSVVAGPKPKHQQHLGTIDPAFREYNLQGRMLPSKNEAELKSYLKTFSRAGL